MAEVALSAPTNGTIEIAGPERVRLSDVVGRFLETTGDPRRVVASSDALYYGYKLDDDTLVPGDGARIAPTGPNEWFRRSASEKMAAQIAVDAVRVSICDPDVLQRIQKCVSKGSKR